MIARAEDGRWLVTVMTAGGNVEDKHILDEEPSEETVRTLLQEAETHHDALERLVDR